MPDPQILIGSAVIVLAGLFIFHRQKVVDKTVPSEQCRAASIDPSQAFVGHAVIA